jgi:tetratricopeptide (TPR) repeat protein
MMKHCFIIFLLVLTVTACSDNGPVDLSFYEQGVAFAAEGKFKKAHKALTRALQDEADRETARQSLEVVENTLSQRLDAQAAGEFFKGVRHGNKGEELLAFSYFSKAIKADPAFADAYYERGIINGRLQLYAEAIADFSRVIKLNPGDVSAYNSRGLARAKGVQEYDKAIEDFTQALKLDPQYAEAYENRGIAYQKAHDDKARACSDWKKACDLNRCNSYHLAEQNGYCQ